MRFNPPLIKSVQSDNQLQFIKSLEWEEVLSIWRGNEENEEHWKTYYKTRGFNSWEGWREKYINPVAAMNKKWGLYKIVDPVAVVPKFHGGMYKGWLPFYNGRRFPAFHEIIRHPDINKHKGIPQFMDNFALKTIVIAWLTKQGVVIIEGMHRCAAIALAEKLGKKIETEMYVAMAEINEGDIPDFTKNKMVTIDDFKKLNIVVGTVESAEEIEGSEKLLKFMINIGNETRQILGGFRPGYLPEELVGKQVLVLENLEPRKMMGLESQGMIMAVGADENGKPVVVQPLKKVPNGTIIK